MNGTALLASFAIAQATPTPSPLFGAFKAACQNVRDFDNVGKAALAAGWSEVAEKDADPRIATIIAKGRDAVKKEEPTGTMTGQLFRHKLDGRDVWLATSRVQFKIDGKDWWGNGCRAYDLDAPAAPTTEAVSNWVGKGPTAVQGSGNAAKLLW